MNYIKNDGYSSDADLQNEILEEVLNSLSQMKPEIISSITEEVTRKMDGRYSSQIGKLEKRISKLENRVSDLQRRVSDAQKAPVQQQTPAGSSGTVKRVTRIPYGAFRFNGWLYYRNADMANFLYRVREDGSENTQLTDHSVMSVRRVEGGYLYYLDGRYQERKLKLN